MIFLTSDTHFGHDNILRYANRPFKNAAEMDRALISNWNNKVTNNDVVYHLGDFAFCSQERVKSIVSQLNFAQLYVLKGNHEKPFCNFIRFDAPKNVSLVCSYMELNINKEFFVLCHYPILEWNKCHHGAYHCYGHVHSKVLPEINEYRAIDVGVDAQNYAPISAEEIIRKYSNRKIKKHHD